MDRLQLTTAVSGTIGMIITIGWMIWLNRDEDKPRKKPKSQDHPRDQYKQNTRKAIVGERAPSDK